MSRQYADMREDLIDAAWQAMSDRNDLDVGLYQLAEAAVDALAASNWQDIETAPNGKDHPYAKLPGQEPATFVIVWNGFHQGVGYCDGLHWWSETGEPIDPSPTHWTHLLIPPQTRSDGL